ncbi:hypothetical protein C2869_21365 [Saccharobesus litoralis]|uniref:Uncharacterized protein n=1 Tax=Saccharobesus litoralis TaxID=2172099 RepID=A0A2S0VXE8_9ALTE|nr:circularly permuted type 2 ATP-grasp protein [Saccharobesus litoralis]AWB68790.1 hypothetical protein C2869_21365 [Saccharobesus litoralis]
MSQAQFTADWIVEYLESQPIHDELLSHSSADAEHWSLLLGRLNSLSREDISGWSNEIKVLLQNSGIGISHNESNWHLDPIPLMLDEVEWQQIERGIQQRLELLNRVKLDLYGEQTLLENGVIRANALRKHASFMRECFAPNRPQTDLFLASIDLYRAPDGVFRVLAERCQCPVGIGALLENRMVVRRVMSDAFFECEVQRIADFFQQMQTVLEKPVSQQPDQTIVILTPGVEDTNYSEHAFLASYLGYPLVRSADLTVRKGIVWLKTLDGLRKVDIIFNWLDEQSIDSLEQAKFSLNGIPGLLHAERTGAVRIVNPLGSGVLESAPVQLAMDNIAQELLGESLILPSQASYLCVEYDVTRLSESQLEQIELYSLTDQTLCLDGVKDRTEIFTRVAENTRDYYYKYKPMLSTAPYWQDGELKSLPIFMRCFALYTPEGVQVLPGALCFAQTKKRGSNWLKDTWIRSVAADKPTSRPLSLQARLTDHALLDGLIPSHTAENLYWLGRYLERGENTVRILRLLIDRYTELSIFPDDNINKVFDNIINDIFSQQLLFPYCLQACGEEQADEKPSEPAEIRAFIASLFFDTSNNGSLLSILNAFFFSAMQVREFLSDDSWQVIDAVKREIKRVETISQGTSMRALQTTLDRCLSYWMAFTGSVADCMANSNGWFMFEMGRRLERSNHLIAVMKSLMIEEYPEVEQHIVLESVLASQVSLITHKRRYRMYQNPASVIELLILDADYPRSLLYQLLQLENLCQHLPRRQRAGILAAQDKAILKSKTTLHLLDHDSLADVSKGKRQQLATLLDDINSNLLMFSEVLSLNYFSHTKQAKSLNWSAT